MKKQNLTIYVQGNLNRNLGSVFLCKGIYVSCHWD